MGTRYGPRAVRRGQPSSVKASRRALRGWGAKACSSADEPTSELERRGGGPRCWTCYGGCTREFGFGFLFVRPRGPGRGCVDRHVNSVAVDAIRVSWWDRAGRGPCLARARKTPVHQGVCFLSSPVPDPQLQRSGVEALGRARDVNRRRERVVGRCGQRRFEGHWQCCAVPNCRRTGLGDADSGATSAEGLHGHSRRGLVLSLVGTDVSEEFSVDVSALGRVWAFGWRPGWSRWRPGNDVGTGDSFTAGAGTAPFKRRGFSERLGGVAVRTEKNEREGFCSASWIGENGTRCWASRWHRCRGGQPCTWTGASYGGGGTGGAEIGPVGETFGPAPCTLRGGCPVKLSAYASGPFPGRR